MLFNSLDFLFFFPIVTLIYFFLPHRYRWLMLLVASCVFYAFFIPVYILILAFTIIVDYFIGIFIEKSVQAKIKLLLLIFSIIANVGVLAVFKYYNFLNEILTQIIGLSGFNNSIPYLNIILPIGLSFHTFQAMSYIIEVYRGNYRAEKNIGIYALYVMFYPQLVAGPIERPQNLLHQFRDEHAFEYERVVSGLKQMLWGFFKKIVIADRFSVFINEVYGNPNSYDGLTLLLATYAFAFQIYCDFSGYSDIAIGAARVMGFTFMENFRTPYFSKSISEFWSRWHISLSTWFKDYVFIPLGGNRVTRWRWFYNLFIVFLLSGLWHGANWTYIVWGGMHGCYLIMAIMTESFREKILSVMGVKQTSLPVKIFNIIFTFHLVLLAWIFFRAESIQDAKNILVKVCLLPFDFNTATTMHYLREMDIGNLTMSFFFLIGFIFADYFMDQIIKNRIQFKWAHLSLIIYSAILAFILIFGFFGDVQFIYYQF